MLNFESGRRLLRRYRDDERGNMALTFAAGAVMVVGSMGAAMDYSTLSNAKKRSQSIADATALSAAIFVKNNDRPPLDDEEGYTEGKHTAYDLGYEYKGWVDGGARNVDVTVVYDDNAKEATVTVRGKTIPTFMQVLGQHDMAFTAKSVVSYLQVDEMHPASIALVLDNSGSMAWDDGKMEDGKRPDNPRSRINGLKTSVKTFRGDLRSRLGDQKANDGQRVLRTGILPYNSDIKDWTNGAHFGMQWAYYGINDFHVNNMVPGGSTNSNPPMAKAKEWLGMENGAHKREAVRTDETYRDPLKFVVFMTDGQNTTGNIEFIEDDTTGRAYRYYGPDHSSGRRGWYVDKWEPFSSGFKEGRLQYDADRKTIESCKAMHAEGTEIYTIGYGLEVGDYYDPDYPDEPKQVTEKTQATAYALLDECASKPTNFIIASDGKELEGAFDQIQNAIVKELIRIKS